MIAPNALVYDARMTPLPNPASGESATHPVDLPAGGGAVIYFFLTLDDNLPLPQTLHHEVDTTACAANANARQTASSDSPVSRAAPSSSACRSAAPAGSRAIRRTLRHAPPHADPQARRNGATRSSASSTRRALRDRLGDGRRRRASRDRAVQPERKLPRLGPANRRGRRRRRSRAPATACRRQPPHNPPNPTVETAGGNYVMQDIGGGHHAFYAHLQPGSIRVREGDRVVRGQIIAPARQQRQLQRSRICTSSFRRARSPLSKACPTCSTATRSPGGRCPRRNHRPLRRLHHAACVAEILADARGGCRSSTRT
jgi:hypothetical protein